MKKVLASIAILFALSLGATEEIVPVVQVDCEQIMKSGDKELIAQSGCCSWHGGVCGCSSGRAACCDGSLSPSCSCKGGESLDIKTDS